MPDYREIAHERLYVTIPGTDTLRKTARNRLKHLLANGWREMERTATPDYIQIKLERTGHAPMRARLPKQVPNRDMRPRRRDGGQGGPRGRR